MSSTCQPVHLRRKALYMALFGGALAVTSIHAASIDSIAFGDNPPAMKRTVMFLAATCNPCAAKKACNPCNPCAAKKACNPCNPCAAKRACSPCNPCAAKKACNPCNPCAAKKACNPCNPCAAKSACNPCNPCGAQKVAASQFVRPGSYRPQPASQALIAEGEKLWNDTSIGTSGLACQSCHVNHAALNPSFAKPYPHKVAMPSQMAGVGAIHLDEMVQFCMVVPMKSDPLPWNSRQLAALTAYSATLQKSFNPCAAKKAAGGACNPCNPCAVKKACNPCAAKKACNPCNPCSAKNPCAAKKNPCKAS